MARPLVRVRVEVVRGARGGPAVGIAAGQEGVDLDRGWLGGGPVQAGAGDRCGSIGSVQRSCQGPASQKSMTQGGTEAVSAPVTVEQRQLGAPWLNPITITGLRQHTLGCLGDDRDVNTCGEQGVSSPLRGRSEPARVGSIDHGHEGPGRERTKVGDDG